MKLKSFPRTEIDKGNSTSELETLPKKNRQIPPQVNIGEFDEYNPIIHSFLYESKAQHLIIRTNKACINAGRKFP